MPRIRRPHRFAVVWVVALLGSMLAATPAHAAVGFGLSLLAGTNGSPTTLAWGPDGRLYVGHFDGTIRVYTVARDGKNDYHVTNTDTISAVSSIPNHNDNGAVNNNVNTRLLLGIAVTGTAQQPVIYASSSDPRIGAGKDGDGDINLDTNSGTLSRLTWNGSAWNHTVLVRGLPRSEENHAPNGIALSSNGNTLYWAYGGHTNKGGPSTNLADLPEYAYSAAVLKVDLSAITNPPYDLPTLDDPSRNNVGGQDVNDPFGGNDGANQAKITAGSPVQVHASGFRNPYDVMIATVGGHAGKMYVPDNGPNAGWGDVPHGEDTNNCTNQSVGQSEQGSNDALHLVTPGYYGGHPNPTRGNESNTFHGESPIVNANPVECDFRGSKTNETTSLSLLPNSSNGIAEYTTDNFDGAMLGDLVIASYQARKIVRISLNSSGTAVTLRDDNLATISSGKPLDVTTMGQGEKFPGTIWIADLATNDIRVMEPNDFDGGDNGCQGTDNPNLDEDEDGYSNADEIDNGTNPCSASSTPTDNDNDDVSDLNDPDDDNDDINDKDDEFAIDEDNGMSTDSPVSITWENDDPPPGGLANTGFTGLMTNGTTNYLNQFNENGVVVGGAAGVLTVGQVPTGDAFKGHNTQKYGFQLGVVPPGSTFTASTRIVAPFDGLNPKKGQSMGLVVGNGTQSNYVRLVVQGDAGGRINLVKEKKDSIQAKRNTRLAMPGPDFVDLFLTINPLKGTIKGSFIATTGGDEGPRRKLGTPIKIPAKWHDGSKALAVGIISTSRGPAPPFPATWDFLLVANGSG